MLDWFTAMLIGIIQGITEWLPVSSSGQTTIVMVNFLGIPVESAITLGLAVHIGTALAVMIKYPLQLSKLRKITATSKFYWATTFISLLVAFPLVLLLSETLESEVWTGLTITLFIGLALIVTGLLLRSGKEQAKRPVSDGKVSDYVLLGVAQGIAVLPGISRSGTTVSTLLMKGFEKQQALVFSFLLSVPVSIASSVYFIVFGNLAGISAVYFAVALVFSFVFGYLTMNALIRIAKDIDFSKFCIFFGGLAVVLAGLLWLID